MESKAESSFIELGENMSGVGSNDHQLRYELRWQRRIRILLYVLSITLLTAQSSQAQAKIAYVLDVNGEWTLNRRANSLKKLNALPAGGVIEFRKASFGNSYIHIADRTGRIIDGRSCDKDDCNKPIVLPKSVPGNPSTLSRLFRAVVSFWRSGPDIYDALIVRTEKGQLEEAIVTLTDGRVDLSAAFKNKLTSKYLLRFTPKGNRRLKGVEEVVFDWDSDKSSPLLVQGIKPGLYEIKLLSLQDRGATEEDVWVLITPPGKYYEATSAQFTQVLAETAQWNAKGLEASRRSFLRAFLGYLDAQKKK